MSALLEKMRRARAFKVEAGGFTFILRRPTDVEWLEMSAQNTARALLPFVIGWEGVKEIDLIPGGDPHPLPFDRDACGEWLADRIDLLPALIDAFIKAYEGHLTARAESVKN